MSQAVAGVISELAPKAKRLLLQSIAHVHLKLMWAALSGSRTCDVSGAEN